MASDASDVSLGSDSTNSRFTTLFAEKSSTKLQTVGLSSKPASHPKNSDEDRQSQLERDMTALRAMNDVHTIMFCSLWFKTRLEVGNWLLKFSPNTSFALVVDVHIICEHLHAQLFGRDSASGNLQNLVKLKLKSDTEGLAVTSFWTAHPQDIREIHSFQSRQIRCLLFWYH